jgi:hypothetical protein
MCLDSLIKRPIQGVSLFWKHQNKAWRTKAKETDGGRDEMKGPKTGSTV